MDDLREGLTGLMADLHTRAVMRARIRALPDGRKGHVAPPSGVVRPCPVCRQPDIPCEVHQCDLDAIRTRLSAVRTFVHEEPEPISTAESEPQRVSVREQMGGVRLD